MFEHHSHPLLPQDRYLRRLALSILAGLSVIVLSLGAGMTGYHRLESLSWLDSFLNASMLLSGMGPLTAPLTDNGKLFAGLYALYSGFVVILVSGMVFAPVVHRTLHRFHLEPTHHAHRTSASSTLSLGVGGGVAGVGASSRNPGASFAEPQSSPGHPTDAPRPPH